MTFDMKTALIAFVRDESGATMVEYVLLASIMGVGLITGLTILKTNVSSMYSKIGSNFS